MHRLSVIAFSLLLTLQASAFGKTPGGSTDPAHTHFGLLFSKEAYSHLNSAGSEFYLSKEEKLLVALCNLARFDGRLFIQEVIVPASADTSNAEMQVLLARLRRTSGLQPLLPAYSLHKTALLHARDMGMQGDSGHIGSDGRNFQQRISAYFPDRAGFAENYHLGSGDPAEIILGLMAGKPESVNYLNNILSPDLHFIGVSIQAHRKSCSNTVMDFARKPNMPAGGKSSGMTRKKSEAYFMDCPKGRDHDQRKKNSFSLINLFSRRK